MRSFLPTLVCVAVVAMFIPEQCVAQPTYIPDPQFRAALNAWAPGLVDGSGFMADDNWGLHPGEWDLQVDWSPCDLSGIEAIDGGIGLTLRFDAGTALTCDTLGVLSYLTLVDYPGTTLPSIGQASSVIIRRAPFISVMGDLDVPDLLELQLDGLDGLTTPPVLPVGLASIIIRRYPEAIALPPLPATLGTVDIGSCDHDLLPALPAGIALLRLDTMPNLTALPALPIGIETLRIMHTGIVDLDVPEMLPTALVWILENPALTTLSIAGDLYTMEVYDAPLLTSFHLEGSVQFLTLERLPALSLISSLGDALYQLEILDAASLTWLPELPGPLNFMTVAACPGLIELPQLPGTMEQLFVSEAPLRCLPRLPDGLTALFLELTQINCMPNHPPGVEALFPLCSVVNSRCKEDRPYAEGRLFWDVDQSGDFTAGDHGIPFATISAQPSGYMTTTDADGRYEMAVPYGAQTLSASSIVVTGDTDPAEHDVLFQFGAASVTGLDFRVDQSSVGTDLRVIGAWGVARLGTNTENSVVVANAGLTRYDVEVRLTMEPLLEYLGSDPAATVDGSDLVWNLDSLGIGQVLQLHCFYSVPIPTPIGTVLRSTASIEPLDGDPLPANNVHSAQGLATGSFDPNDKQVFPAQLSIEEGADGARVEYLIRCQNTGNSYAERVLIIDTLSSDLDHSSIEFLGASHASTWFYRDGALHFLFDPIYLPDSTTDEPGSHGFVSFSIRTQPGLMPNASVPNEADIYFDFNEPVITDPCPLTVETPQAVSAYEAEVMELYPVPSSGLVSMRNTGALIGATFAVLNGTGAVVQSGRITGTSLELDLRNNVSGVYQIRVDGEQGIWNGRLIIE